MITKKITLLFLSLSFFISSFSQDIAKGNLVKEVFSEWYSFKHENETILVQNYKEKGEKEYLITIVDSDLKEKNSYKITHTDDNLIHISFSDEIIYFLFQNRNRDINQIEFYIKKVALEGFIETKQSLFKVTEINDSKTISRFFKANSSFAVFGDFSIIDDYVGITYDIRYDDKKERINFLFDKNFNQIFKQSKVYSRNSKGDKFVTMSSYIDETTNSLITLNKKHEDGDFILESINKNNYLSKNFSFKEKGHGDLKIIRTTNGIHCVGFYFNDKKKGDDAVFYSSFSDDLEIKEEKYLSFTEDFFNSLSKTQKKKGILLHLFKVMKDDFNNIYIIGEAGRVQVNGGVGTGERNLSRINDDVIVCKIDNVSELKWSKLVEKSQKFYYGHYNAFKPFLIDNKLKYLFNSEFDLEKVKTDAKSNKGMHPGSAQRFNLYLVSFEDNGDFSHQQITNKKEDLRYVPINSSLVKNESIFIYGSKKKDNEFLKINF